MSMNMPSALHPNSGTEERFVYEGMSKASLSSLMANHFVSASRPSQGAQKHPTSPDTSSQAVGSQDTVLRNVLRCRKTKPITPYKPSTWRHQLHRHGLLKRYPKLYHRHIHGFDLRIPSILQSYMFQLIILLLIRNMKKLWRKSSKKGDILAPSPGQSLRLSLAPFNHPPSPLFPNWENQGNTTWFTTSHTRISHP